MRVSPEIVYRPPLQQMLPHAGRRLEVTQGEVYWQNGQMLSHATVELWPPTPGPKRSRELRLSRWWSVDAWDIPVPIFTSELRAGRRMFYVLELDAEGTAWARVMRESALDAEDPVVAAQIRARIADCATAKSLDLS